MRNRLASGLLAITLIALISCEVETTSELEVTEYIDSEPLTYSETLALLDEGRIDEVEIRPPPGSEVSTFFYQLGDATDAPTWVAEDYQVFVHVVDREESIPVLAPDGNTAGLTEEALSDVIQAVADVNSGSPGAVDLKDLRDNQTPPRQ